MSLVCLVLALLLAKPRIWSLCVGLALTFLGLALRTWACGHLEKEKKLAVSGPYRFTRNPLYLGNLVIGTAVAVGAHSLWVWLMVAVFFLAFYPAVVAAEAKKMKRLFPEEYPEYSRRVPLFFPRIRPPTKTRTLRFNSTLYRKNREWRALLGAVIFWSLMAGKLLLF